MMIYICSEKGCVKAGNVVDSPESANEVETLYVRNKVISVYLDGVAFVMDEFTNVKSVLV